LTTRWSWSVVIRIDQFSPPTLPSRWIRENMRVRVTREDFEELTTVICYYYFDWISKRDIRVPHQRSDGVNLVRF
jgi:hypothetical protein